MLMDVTWRGFRLPNGIGTKYPGDFAAEKVIRANRRLSSKQNGTLH